MIFLPKIALIFPYNVFGLLLVEGIGYSTNCFLLLFSILFISQ